MSTFTKFLIVLLTISAVFLCGIVVTYVGSASNWKQQYQEREDTIAEMKRSLTQKQRQAKKEITAIQDEYDALLAENTELKSIFSKTEIELNNTKRNNLVFSQRVNDATGVIEGLQQTIEGLRTSLEATSGELNIKRSEVAVISKKLNEITSSLDERMVELDSIEAENKRLLEVKTEMEKMVSGVADTVRPITMKKDIVSMAAAPVIYDTIDLRALISEVDLKNKLATITIGAADGVEKGMRFHITRGNDFVCDVVITHIDQEKAAGVLELVQSTPRVGDNVATSL